MRNPRYHICRMAKLTLDFFFFHIHSVFNTKCSYSGETKEMKLKSLNLVTSKNILLDKCLCNIVVDAITNYHTRALKETNISAFSSGSQKPN